MKEKRATFVSQIPNQLLQHAFPLPRKYCNPKQREKTKKVICNEKLEKNDENHLGCQNSFNFT